MPLQRSGDVHVSIQIPGLPKQFCKRYEFTIKVNLEVVPEEEQVVDIATVPLPADLPQQLHPPPAAAGVGVGIGSGAEGLPTPMLPAESKQQPPQRLPPLTHHAREPLHSAACCAAAARDAPASHAQAKHSGGDQPSRRDAWSYIW